MNLKVLVFADEPDLAAELFLTIESAGPFEAFPITNGSPGDQPDIPEGDVAVIVLGGDTDKYAALAGSLSDRNLPVISIGKAPELKKQGVLVELASPKDHDSLIRHLKRFGEEDSVKVPITGGGAVPGPQTAVTGRS